ncbi:macrophage mannose receptor 1-like isoform X2 [Clarias gariepinus]|uniref:macrophage mannose receptor 1-like isoform X2 n=1 Tax=Clarias gariepinus TaxID=13013 RepID=UPI00234D9C8F|nr:macrophage mannose receptor 1-like isoform X2 [Clarias gariepinus]
MAGVTQELACVRLKNMMHRKWMKLTVFFVLLLNLSHCFAQPDENFLIYNAQKNKCLTDNLQSLTVCDPLSLKQQFRWTSGNRIFNVAQKKCLGVGSKKEGNKLQWYICNARNDLQKWECTNDTQFSLKNESLYLSLQGKTLSLTLSRKQEVKSQWTIHGTTDNICSQPYQESYTLRGNGFGRACHFPFRYKNKWYSACTIDGSSIKRLWCAIESIYEDNELWGYCPTRQTDDFWTKNPLTGMYYQINKDSALTWYQARKSCQQQGGDLASITEPHEQTLISGLTQGNGPVLWTGLNSLDPSSGWHWINGQPLRYLHWLSGQPSPQPGRNCGAVNQQFDSKWSTDDCSARHGYICQKVLQTPTIPPMVHTGSCPRPWIPYLGHCYYLNRAKKTWLEAKDSCRRDGGDLLSILSVEEQSFAISQLGYLKTDELWIGLNDLKTAMYFEWSDHSSVPFVSWEINEPSHNADNKEDCVIMRGEEGKWSDENCKNKYGFICKKGAHSTPSTNDTVITSPGCKSGWTRYGYYCYFIGTETKTFDEAKQMCVKSDSYLVDITNRVENAFLVSLVGMRPEKHFWIGLSNTKDRHTFKWTNSRKVLYTHFNAGLPGRKQGCVAITTGTFAGLWDVLSCTDKVKYICKQMAVDVITTPAPTTIPAPNCSNEWFPLTNRDFCVKLFEVEHEQQKTWSEALDFCRKLGGDLLSIHSPFDLTTSLNQISTQGAWIGYSIQDPSVGYVWSDGSPTSYENWKDDEPNNLNDVENCAEITIWWWLKRGEWNDRHCEGKNDWICEIRKGDTPNEVEITTKTYNKTDDGWIIFDDNQYYISKHSYVSMEEARMFCKQKHGDLVTINDEEERLFLWHQDTGHNAFYIGMIIDLDQSLSWMDGSPVVFEAWQKNQPAFLNDEDRCVTMTFNQGFWESINCGDRKNFICKRSGAVEVNSTAAPIEQSKGGCAPDWVKFESKCYKIELELKTWREARSHCRRLGGDLASITRQIQQAFLTLMLDGDNNAYLWIGFSNLANKGYKWTDGSVVSYTGWAKGEPSRSEWLWDNEEPSCIAMGNMHRPEQGKWITKDCNDTSGFICSRAIDHFIEPIPTKTPTTFIKLGNDSYMILQKNLTWSEAQQHCKLEGAHLASIRDVLAQSYIELQAAKLGQPLWIGLNSAETDGYFLWIDNWHLNMENWGENEPKSNQPCVYVDVEGKWITAYCNETSYSLCKKSTEIAPTPPMQYPGVCPDITDVEPRMIWIPYKGHCYAFVKESVSWSRASQFCLARDANLVSIEDTKEAKFIENYISFLGNDQEKFSIGLFKTHTEHWLWLDRSVVDYTNWEESTEHDGYTQDCAFISTKTKQWGKQHCIYGYSSFICKTAKVAKPTTSAKIGPTDKPVTYRSLAGVAVVMLIAVLSALAALAYVYQRRTRHQAAVPSFENPMYYTTENLPPENKDTKTLVDNMEINN